MQPFRQHRGIVAPFDRANVDTDLIIPKQFLKSVKRTGFGDNLFDQLRYADEGVPGMDNSKRQRREEFVLNQPAYHDATILLTGENFGCGSSREHAPWALHDFGFRILIGPSFADIFYNNCFKNGLLAIVLSVEEIEALFAMTAARPGCTLLVDLESRQITTESSEVIDFSIDEHRRHCLLEGLDDIAMTLQNSEKIRAFEEKRRLECPWLFEKYLGSR